MDRETLEAVKKVHLLFKDAHLTLSVAESCTGGLVSHDITSLPGASVFFRAGVVSYSEQSKVDILGISHDVIGRYGVVSSETAREMCKRVRILSGSDCSLSTTGNLGPGVLEGKAEGLVYVAASSGDSTVHRELRLKGNREENKHAAAAAALKLLIELMEN